MACCSVTGAYLWDAGKGNEKLMSVPDHPFLLGRNRADCCERVVLYLARCNVTMFCSTIANQGDGRHNGHENQQYEPTSKGCKKSHKVFGRMSSNKSIGKKVSVFIEGCTGYVSIIFVFLLTPQIGELRHGHERDWGSIGCRAQIALPMVSLSPLV